MICAVPYFSCPLLQCSHAALYLAWSSLHLVSCTSHNVTQIVGAVACRQAVPLTVALLNVSNPNLNAVDTLSRLSHDTDIQVAQNAVLALGKHTFYLISFN